MSDPGSHFLEASLRELEMLKRHVERALAQVLSIPRGQSREFLSRPRPL